MAIGEVGSPGQSVLRAVEVDLNLSQGSVTLHHHLMVVNTVMERTLNGEIVTLMLVLSLVKKTYKNVFCLALKMLIINSSGWRMGKLEILEQLL